MLTTAVRIYVFTVYSGYKSRGLLRELADRLAFSVACLFGGTGYSFVSCAPCSTKSHKHVSCKQTRRMQVYHILPAGTHASGSGVRGIT